MRKRMKYPPLEGVRGRREMNNILELDRNPSPKTQPLEDAVMRISKEERSTLLQIVRHIRGLSIW